MQPPSLKLAGVEAVVGLRSNIVMMDVLGYMIFYPLFYPLEMETMYIGSAGNAQ